MNKQEWLTFLTREKRIWVQHPFCIAKFSAFIWYLLNQTCTHQNSHEKSWREISKRCIWFYMIICPPVRYILLLGQELSGRLGVFGFGSFAHFLGRSLCDNKWILLIWILSWSTWPYQDLTSINAIVVHMAVEQMHTFQPLLGWLSTFSSCLVEFSEICIYDSWMYMKQGRFILYGFLFWNFRVTGITV